VKPKIYPSIVAFFCEDIREEKSNRHSVVGLLGDNLTVPSVPGLLPRLGVYARGRFDIEKPPKSFVVRLVFPWQEEPIQVGQMLPEEIQTAFDKAQNSGRDSLGIMVRSVFSPFPIRGAGRIRILVETGSKVWDAGVLNITVKPPDAPTEEQQQVTKKRVRKLEKARKGPSRRK
jgi:hypothetical protein